VGGVVSVPLKKCEPWTEEEPYHTEMEKCEALKQKMGIADE